MKAEGLDGVFAALDAVERKVKQKGVKKGMSAATKIVAKSAKYKVRRKTGLLEASIGRKTKAYRRGATTVGMVGARVGMGAVVSRVYGRKPEYSDPSKYAHLVELGTVHSRAFPYLKPAVDDNVGKIKDAIKDAIAEVLS
jgi:HK97 gp10 family phage protein